MQSTISSPNSYQLLVNSVITECLFSFQIVAKYAPRVKSEALIFRSKGKNRLRVQRYRQKIQKQLSEANQSKSEIRQIEDDLARKKGMTSQRNECGSRHICHIS